MLKKIQKKIIWRLQSKTNLANPWRSSFIIDIPLKVIEMTLSHIIQGNNFVLSTQNFSKTDQI